MLTDSVGQVAALPDQLIAEPREPCVIIVDAPMKVLVQVRRFEWAYIAQSPFLVWRGPRVAGPA